MTLASDMAVDYQWQDGVESVTFTALSGTTTASVQAVRGGLNERETTLAAAGAYSPNDIVWELWAATMGTAEPVQGCLVTDSDGVVYTIQSVGGTAFGSTVIKWRCVCRKQR